MTLDAAALDGRLVIRVSPQGVRVRSSRPLRAARVLVGRTPHEAAAWLPRLYAVCGNAQTVAGLHAMEAATATALDPAQDAARDLLVRVESLREHLLRVFTSWAPELDLAVPAAAATQAMVAPGQLARALFPDGDGLCPGGGRLRPDRAALAVRVDGLTQLVTRQVLGCPPNHWLSLEDLDDALALASGGALGPVWLAALLARQWAGCGALRLPALPVMDAAELSARLGGDAADTFVAAPTWQGRPCETGAYVRQYHHALVRDARSAYGDGLLARMVARLVEIAALVDSLAGRSPAPAQPEALRPTDGDGTGQLETARGRLAHWVKLRAGRILDYRILAPTEWNFHPEGLLARALATLPLDRDTEALAGLLVGAVDPCVGFDLEVGGHA